jgi:hypothetical protein
MSVIAWLGASFTVLFTTAWLALLLFSALAERRTDRRAHDDPFFAFLVGRNGHAGP